MVEVRNSKIGCPAKPEYIRFSQDLTLCSVHQRTITGVSLEEFNYIASKLKYGRLYKTIVKERMHLKLVKKRSLTLIK